jgi:hypothetical protein
MGDGGREHPPKTGGKRGVVGGGDAKSDAKATQSIPAGGQTPQATPQGDAGGLPREQAPQLPPELAGLVKAWPTLPPAIRAGILAMVQAAGGGSR